MRLFEINSILKLYELSPKRIILYHLKRDVTYGIKAYHKTNGLTLPMTRTKKISACMWGRVLRNNLTLLVDKILGMFIRNEQPSLIEPVLWDKLGPWISLYLNILLQRFLYSFFNNHIYFYLSFPNDHDHRLIAWKNHTTLED